MDPSDESRSPFTPPRRSVRMRVREWMHRKAASLTGAAVMIAVAGLALMVALNPSKNNRMDDATRPSPGQAWFYDTTTGVYFTELATRVPPIVSPAGNPAVRAHFFTCGSCEDDAERFLGYYEKYTPEVKRRLENAPETFEFYEEAFNGRLYSADAQHWVEAESPDGLKIVERLQEKCPSRSLRYCPPQ
ncbi:MAG: hypothetical protein GC162_00015 [Planctomycetes bacterium]|nr:hypothetical protein [Planctomycetota bacterium]